MEDYIVSIDIGTSKICVLVGRVDKTNYIEILAKEIAANNGVKKGIIVDVDHTAEIIRSCLDRIESSKGILINSAFVNIIGMHVSVINNTYSIRIDNPGHEITKSDVEKLLYEVGNIQIPEGREIIDVIPRFYSIDGYDDITDPVGMVGTNLQVHADIIIGRITSVKNIIKSVEKAGIKIDGIVTEAYAEGQLLLTDDEREAGSILIDVGAGITDVSIFWNKMLIFYDSMPVGGDHITNDISIGLKISYQEAEAIKRKYELALTSLINNDQELEVVDINQDHSKSIMVSDVVEIIEARVYEIFSLCRDIIEKAGLNTMNFSNVVLTGGGISYVDGNKQIAEEVFGIPARVAVYKTSVSLKPELYAAAGIIKYVSTYYKGNIAQLNQVVIKKQKSSMAKTSFFDKLLSWIKGLF
ncbi:MAG TPA: cell division protein FtsA [Clostridiaceae bacterium]|nr:cell division protein FtsA [Clostridiaceae bacterium]